MLDRYPASAISAAGRRPNPPLATGRVAWLQLSSGSWMLRILTRASLMMVSYLFKMSDFKKQGDDLRKYVTFGIAKQFRSKYKANLMDMFLDSVLCIVNNYPFLYHNIN